MKVRICLVFVLGLLACDVHTPIAPGVLIPASEGRIVNHFVDVAPNVGYTTVWTAVDSIAKYIYHSVEVDFSGEPVAALGPVLAGSVTYGASTTVGFSVPCTDGRFHIESGASAVAEFFYAPTDYSYDYDVSEVSCPLYPGGGGTGGTTPTEPQPGPNGGGCKWIWTDVYVDGVHAWAGWLEWCEE